VAFFTDSYHEVNGVALTSRQFDAFARRRNLPFLNVHAGPETRFARSGGVATLELGRGPVKFRVERDMFFDLGFLRHRGLAARTVRDFGADLIHITGPSDCGILGVFTAWRLGLPLVASWHTNLHEFAGRRLEKLLARTPAGFRRWAGRLAESASLDICASYYRRARGILAPNRELMDLMHRLTSRPVFLMRRGVETGTFSPEFRRRDDDAFVLGFVGRVTPEKSVRFLKRIEEDLLAAGHTNFRFLVVGDGSELGWLRENLKHGEFPGVLQGEALSRAYANMDLFVFPSHTDTFGNVVQEAMASGVPSIVTASGGPKFLVRSGETGFVAADDASFLRLVRNLIEDRELHARLCRLSREHALTLSWDSVFEEVYHAYGHCLAAARPAPALAPLRI
jgi:glycosyltransferase involved in cell wall biosynthesis